MKRILIIGGNGSGKTTMARQLAEVTGLPVCHLDTLYWTDDWQPRERSEFTALLQAELEKEEWILDGNMRRTLPQRLPYCDTVIYLDFSGIRCFFGTLKRLKCYTISAVDKHPKIWYNKKQGTRKEGNEDGTI